jgi:hypothetical protein
LGQAHSHLGGDKITAATKATAPGCIPDFEPFPFRQRKKRRKVGPFSKRLSFAMLDLRTQEGRYARDICDGIAADLGGVPERPFAVLELAAGEIPKLEPGHPWRPGEAVAKVKRAFHPSVSSLLPNHLPRNRGAVCAWVAPNREDQ